MAAGISPSGAAMSAERVDLADVVGDVEIPCEIGAQIHSRSGGGSSPAAWVVTPVKHCDRVIAHVLVCDPCMQYVLTSPSAYLCSYCEWSCIPLRHSVSGFERIDKTPGRHPGGPA